MKKTVFLAAAAITLASCSSDELVNSTAGDMNGESPIAFSVEKKNITRGEENVNVTKLEATGHYNFGVWAYKYKTGASQLVMNNYLVGYSNGSNLGYDKSNSTTWESSAGFNTDHKSPWFYEGLGTAEYTNPAYGYATSATEYMSNNTNQYLRYWDLAYENTNFYCYAPYVKNDKTNGKEVTFDYTSGEMKFAAKTIRDGYDETLNSTYTAYDRSLSEFMYASVQATNSDLSDVTIPFKHMGAQIFIRFYEDIPGYKVELINLGDDNGTMVSSATDELTKGIQVTPAVKSGTTFKSGKYYTTQGATVKFDTDMKATYTPSWDGSTQVSTNLMFQIPTEGKATSNDAPANLTVFHNHKVIKEIPNDGDQEYSYSPTIYYAVAQPTIDQTTGAENATGLTFHVSYRIIAEDNQEVITVHNATVHVPYKDSSNNLITVWQPNVKYTYSFKITKNTTGSTNPGDKIDPTNPEESTTKGLYPIVFDGATIEDYTGKTPGSDISGEETTY